jgi:hypothetical protein
MPSEVLVRLGHELTPRVDILDLHIARFRARESCSGDRLLPPTGPP